MPAAAPLRSRAARSLSVAFTTMVVLIGSVAGAPDASARGVTADGTHAEERHPVPVYVFWGRGCPHCENQKRFLETLQSRHPTMDVRLFEVWYDPGHRALMTEMAEAFGRSVSAVPMTFIGDEAWVGFSDGIARQMAESIAAYERYAAPDPIERLSAEWRREVAPAAPPERTLALPLVGTLDVAARPLLVGTVLIALADGFNPCSLWVLALLLGVVINTRSRRRVALVGIVFLGITALAYALFIAGIFTVLAFMPSMPWVRGVVALVALGFAAINIKDYFAFGRGISLTIDDAHKPRLYRRIRGIMKERGSVPATILATATLALGVTLVELPCTAGLPMLWTSLVAESGAGAGTFAGLLTIYMLVYLFDELLIFGLAVMTMRAIRMEEREGRVLKLVSGAVMAALGFAMVARPEALESVAGMMSVFGLALGGSLVITLGHHLVHPASSPLRRTAH